MATKKRSTKNATTQSTSERILDAALSVFAEAGFDGASTREIARRADVHQQQITYHFGTKEALWKAAVGSTFKEINANLDVALAAPPPERMRKVVECFLRFGSKHPVWPAFIVHEGLSPSARATWLANDCVWPMMMRLNEGIMGGRFPKQRGAQQMRAFAILALVNAAHALFPGRANVLRLTGIDTSADAFVNEYVDVVVVALRALLKKPRAKRAAPLQ